MKKRFQREQVLQTDGELHVTQLPYRKGDRVRVTVNPLSSRGFFAAVIVLVALAVMVAIVVPFLAPNNQLLIQRVLDEQVAAWNRGDLEGFMAGYWNSPDLTFFSGKEVRHGWQETIGRYQARYQAEGKEMGKLSFSDVQIHLDQGRSQRAWVTGHWQVITAKETLEGIFTLIFEKIDRRWSIIHDHTSGA